jgi:putative transposase
MLVPLRRSPTAPHGFAPDVLCAAPPLYTQMTYDPARHHRRSIRLRGFDYRSTGAYMVTVNTHRRAHLFGVVVDATMVLNALGQCALTQWQELAAHFPHIRLDTVVVMPDHLHAIIHIAPDAGEDVAPVEGRLMGTSPQSLSAVIQNYKSVCARKLRKLDPGIAQVWQTNFYESVIRTQESLDDRRAYILANPERWEERRRARGSSPPPV